MAHLVPQSYLLNPVLRGQVWHRSKAEPHTQLELMRLALREIQQKSETEPDSSETEPDS